MTLIVRGSLLFEGHNGSEIRQYMQNLQVNRPDSLSVLINASIESERYETSYFNNRSKKHRNRWFLFKIGGVWKIVGEYQDLRRYGSG